MGNKTLVCKTKCRKKVDGEMKTVECNNTSFNVTITEAGVEVTCTVCGSVNIITDKELI